MIKNKIPVYIFSLMCKKRNPLDNKKIIKNVDPIKKLPTMVRIISHEHPPPKSKNNFEQTGLYSQKSEGLNIKNQIK